jgi:hypothetical protein
MDMKPGLGGTVCFDEVRYMASEVPSTRCALLVGSSRREGHSCAEGSGGVGMVVSSAASAFFCALRPGMGKENFPRRAMVEGERRLPAGELVACCWLGCTTQAGDETGGAGWIAQFRAALNGSLVAALKCTCVREQSGAAAASLWAVHVQAVVEGVGWTSQLAALGGRAEKDARLGHRGSVPTLSYCARRLPVPAATATLRRGNLWMLAARLQPETCRTRAARRGCSCDRTTRAGRWYSIV